MEQTKIESLVEAIVNAIIGFLISFIAWPVVAWLFNAPVTTKQQAGIVFCFTILSVARSYVLRRWFNGWLRRFNHMLAMWIYSLMGSSK